MEEVFDICNKGVFLKNLSIFSLIFTFYGYSSILFPVVYGWIIHQPLLKIGVKILFLPFNYSTSLTVPRIWDGLKLEKVQEQNFCPFSPCNNSGCFLEELLEIIPR